MIDGFTPKARVFSVDEHAEWMNSVFEIYRRMRARETPYKTRICGFDLTVNADVYAPDFFTDTAWFASTLPKFVRSQRLLEIGTGTGAISLACAAHGARVVATDVNPSAVENARLNFASHGLNTEVREGNLFEPISSDEFFDFIFWAHPFNNWPKPVNDTLLLSGLDTGYAGIRGYFEGAHHHLAPEGKLLLGTGDSADIRTILEFASSSKYAVRILAQTTLPLEYEHIAEITYYLLEFSRTT